MRSTRRRARLLFVVDTADGARPYRSESLAASLADAAADGGFPDRPPDWEHDQDLRVFELEPVPGASDANDPGPSPSR